MKTVLTGFVVLALFVSSYASATVYNYTGANFTATAGSYTTAMRITGTIATNSPIPPNSVDFDISGILTSWSFSDGVQTISDVTGVLHPHPTLVPAFDTDGLGNITGAVFLTLASKPLGTTLLDTDSIIQIHPSGGGLDTAYVDAPCVNVSSGVCRDWNFITNSGQSKVGGVWETVPPPEPVPTMFARSLILLAFILGLIGLVRVKSLA